MVGFEMHEFSCARCGKDKRMFDSPRHAASIEKYEDDDLTIPAELCVFCKGHVWDHDRKCMNCIIQYGKTVYDSV